MERRAAGLENRKTGRISDIEGTLATRNAGLALIDNTHGGFEQDQKIIFQTVQRRPFR